MKRPFRIWDTRAKAFVRWRYYAILRNAHNAAIVESHWSPVGRTLEILHAETSAVYGQYTRDLHSVRFTKIKEK